MIVRDDEFFMKEALRCAKVSLESKDVPIGAVVVYKKDIIAYGYNQVELLKDPTAHAEMIAITSATEFFKNKWLIDCDVYITLEPCIMCVGALILARVRKVVFGAYDTQNGFLTSKADINRFHFNHKIKYTGGVLSDECSILIKDFFKRLREEKKTPIYTN